VYQILSKSGEFIYVLIYANDEVLKKEADRIHFNLELEIGAIDLLSMEPIDVNLRPLRYIFHTKPLNIIEKEKTLEPLYESIFMNDDNRIQLFNFRYFCPRIYKR